MLIYFATIAIEVPFLNTSVYVGPIARHLGQADLSWLVGLIVGAVGYQVFATRGNRRTAQRQAARATVPVK